MRERPILFQGAMVRAILAGTKTQTRRAVRDQSMVSVVDGEVQLWTGFMGWQPLWVVLADAGMACKAALCPYGATGDRLWVRETFFAFGRWETRFSGKKGRDEWHFIDMTLECGHGYHFDVEDPEMIVGAKGRGGAVPMWWKRPAIHMPRAASRILLQVTGVRVERLQDISEDDAGAEGCERLTKDEPGYVFRDEPDWKLCPQCGGTRLYTSYGPNMGACFDTDCTKCDTYAKRYRWLWESISGPGSWDANPWVWVISFRRLTP